MQFSLYMYCEVLSMPVLARLRIVPKPRSLHLRAILSTPAWLMWSR